MYVESWAIIIVATIFIYMTYRIIKLKRTILSLMPILDEQRQNDLLLRRNLIKILLASDNKILSNTNASEKMKNDILSEQADYLKTAFQQSRIKDYFMNGERIEDNSVESYLSDAIGISIDYVETDIESTNSSIKEALKLRMEEIKTNNNGRVKPDTDGLT